jgi:hypothetical protein
VRTACEMLGLTISSRLRNVCIVGICMKFAVFPCVRHEARYMSSPMD